LQERNHEKHLSESKNRRQEPEQHRKKARKPTIKATLTITVFPVKSSPPTMMISSKPVCSTEVIKLGISIDIGLSQEETEKSSQQHGVPKSKFPT
jgi:hypothetical protein